MCTYNLLHLTSEYMEQSPTVHGYMEQLLTWQSHHFDTFQMNNIWFRSSLAFTLHAVGYELCCQSARNEHRNTSFFSSISCLCCHSMFRFLSGNQSQQIFHPDQKASVNVITWILLLVWVRAEHESRQQYCMNCPDHCGMHRLTAVVYGGSGQWSAYHSST